MTQPYERTKALTDTRRLLETLHESEQPLMWALVRTAAASALRHYPNDDDVAASAAALPSLWASPPAQQTFAAKADCNQEVRNLTGKLRLVEFKPPR
ncbi:hypothetical protein AWB74_08513 [Caballeronia arvi]|uniref:Uncharacterized protein n=1 Tax=Caballeronia arvi TaxID=1777135 RepID=A0A158L4H5_9BURK|nr:hypothetical protein AWB74_08513 [Caballeronia arvi]